MKQNIETNIMAPDDLLVEWLNSLEEVDRSPKTVTRYRGAVSHFLAWYGDEERRPIEPGDLTPIALAGYRSYLQKKNETSTVNVHISALRSWCQWLVEHDYLDESPATRLKLVRQVQSDAPEPLSNTAVNALLRAAQRGRHGKRDHAILQMLLQTGMRIGECQSLGWQDITFQERKGLVLIRSGKGNKSRTIPLNSSIRSALVDYAAPILDCRPTAKEVARQWPKSQEAQGLLPLWVSQKGNQLSSPAMWRVINRVVVECANRELVPGKIKPHDLRHTFAHRYLQQHPGDLAGLARILGHASLDTTKIYTRLTPGELAQRVEQIPLNAYG
jgi:site-specific recombinase XerD